MLLNMQAARSTPPRLAVFAYDIGSPRRARAARAVLRGVQIEAQYSVFEARLTAPEFRGLLAEVSSACDLSADRLAVWWPRGGVRFEWRDRRLRVRGANAASLAAAARGALNFIVCYDVSDDEARLRVARAVAANAAQVQRSVYWLRAAPGAVLPLLERCAAALGEGDRLWVYPLRRAGDLWQVGAQEAALLPMAAHHWR